MVPSRASRWTVDEIWPPRCQTARMSGGKWLVGGSKPSATSCTTCKELEIFQYFPSLIIAPDSVSHRTALWRGGARTLLIESLIERLFPPPGTVLISRYPIFHTLCSPTEYLRRAKRHQLCVTYCMLRNTRGETGSHLGLHLKPCCGDLRIVIGRHRYRANSLDDGVLGRRNQNRDADGLGTIL